MEALPRSVGGRANEEKAESPKKGRQEAAQGRAGQKEMLMPIEQSKATLKPGLYPFLELSRAATSFGIALLPVPCRKAVYRKAKFEWPWREGDPFVAFRARTGLNRFEQQLAKSA